MSSSRIKFCGITCYRDAAAALDLGVDLLGFNFFEKSPRCVSVADATAIVRRLPASISTVGVFVNHSREEIESISRAVALDTLQFHGDETLSFLDGWEEWNTIKAIRLDESANIDKLDDFLSASDYLLIDRYESESYGGTGREVSKGLLEKLKSFSGMNKTFLSGGLTPENVAEKIALLQPHGVDVASGIEDAPGVKSLEKMKAFVDSVKG